VQSILVISFDVCAASVIAFCQNRLPQAGVSLEKEK
jgi:hypothetical protein